MSSKLLHSNNLSGKWWCRYWFPSNKKEGEEKSEYKVTIHHNGKNIILESLPNTDESYMLARMVIDGDVATGTWQEHTAKNGEFAGTVYSGALQLLLNGDNDRLDGLWVGIGQETGEKKIYSGKWEIVRA